VLFSAAAALNRHFIGLAPHQFPYYNTGPFPSHLHRANRGHVNRAEPCGSSSPTLCYAADLRQPSKPPSSGRRKGTPAPTSKPRQVHWREILWLTPCLGIAPLVRSISPEKPPRAPPSVSATVDALYTSSELHRPATHPWAVCRPELLPSMFCPTCALPRPQPYFVDVVEFPM
jgi:hypothetical protein